MSERSAVIAKILSLYLITSALFLGYFFTNDYKMKKEALVSNEVKNLKEIKMGIYMKARMDGLGAVESFTAEKDVKACIVAKSGQILYGEAGCAKFDDAQSGAVVSDGKVTIFEALQNMEQWLKNAGRPISEAIPSSIKNLQYFFQGVADEYKIPTIAQAGKDFTNKLFDLLHNAPQKKQIKTIGSVELLKEIQSLKVAIRTLHNPAFKKTSKK